MKTNFQNPADRLVRLGIYSLLGMSVFVPVIHDIIHNGWQVQNRRVSYFYFACLTALNFTGASIYVARISERWYPRTFDNIGSRHQIMHVLVICGAFSYTTGPIQGFRLPACKARSSQRHLREAVSNTRKAYDICRYRLALEDSKLIRQAAHLSSLGI